MFANFMTVIASAIFLFWVVSVVWLIRDRYSKPVVKNIRVLKRSSSKGVISAEITYGLEVNTRPVVVDCYVSLSKWFIDGVYLDTGEHMKKDFSRQIFDQHLRHHDDAERKSSKLKEYRTAYGYPNKLETAEDRLMNLMMTHASLDEVLKASAEAAEERKRKTPS